MLIREFIVEGKFTSKQQVIDHFVKQGKTAAQGASAWARGWRGPVESKPKLSTKQPRSDWQHKWEKDRDLGEMIGPVGNRASVPNRVKLDKPRKVEPVEPGVKVDIRRERPRDPDEHVYKKPKQGGLAEAKSKLSKEAEAAIPGIGSSGRPDGPINSYQKYRVGMAMACSPDTGNVSTIGPIADDMVTVGYTAADQDISDRAYKALGFKKKRVTSDRSREHDAHTVSPVAKPKRNRYGV